MLYNKLKEMTFKNETQIKEQIQVSDLDSETKQILSLNFDWLILENKKNIYAQDSLNKRADNFLETYAHSRFEDFTKTYIRYKLVVIVYTQVI